MTIAPVRKQIVVDASVEHAFLVFTERFDTWWPLETHHIGAITPDTGVIEGHVGGRCFERSPDGTETVWGHVLAWEPPTRLVLSWEVSHDWVCDPANMSEVEVRFIAESPTRTRVELEHGKLEVAFGEHAQEMYDTFNSEGGWNGLLTRFAAAATEQPGA
ncbi:MAG: hypothetical protein JWL83_4229 [Actinomycetia bacterium]|nr:hypothetical protein [Actinomycetes bacterium]